MNTTLPILHAFDPKLKFIKPKNGEVRFVKGKYIDIANTKGKDIYSLYFGTSTNSDLLTGIFLGDYELTSKVKDVSLYNKDNNLVLSVKYINEHGKLSTVTAKLPNSSSYNNIINDINAMKNNIKKLDTSIKGLSKKLNIINSSVSIIETRLNIIDTSINELINDLSTGNFNYTLRESISSFEDGLQKTYTLFKGEQVSDSSTITLNDYVLKKLEYDSDNNKLIASIWPDACGDDIYQWETVTDPDGHDTSIKTAKLKDEYIKKIELNLDEFETHVVNNVLENTSICERLTNLETQLKWEDLFN